MIASLFASEDTARFVLIEMMAATLVLAAIVCAIAYERLDRLGFNGFSETHYPTFVPQTLDH
jgi:hypothetical protein